MYLHESAFIMFFIPLREFDLEKVSPSVRWNLRGVCSHVDCRWQISCSRLWEFATPNSNAIIWKTKNFFSIFCFISGIYIKFETFWNKRWWSWLMSFGNYGLWKAWLERSLKSPVSEHALTVKMWKRRKCMENVHMSTFIIFFCHSQGRWFGKCLP